MVKPPPFPVLVAAAALSVQTAGQTLPAESAAARAGRLEKRIELDSARDLVHDAVGLVASGLPARALGEIARALTIDPASMPARSLAFDQLMRGPLARLSRDGTEKYVHAPLVHPAPVLFAVFSPDGRSVGTASRDNIVRLWDVASGRQTGEIAGHSQALSTVAFSPDGSRIATASLDQTARVWDVASHRQLAEMRSGSRVTSVAFSSDGRRIVTASQDHTAQVWDAATSAKSGPAMAHPLTVNYASFSPDGQYVVTACADSKARIWRVAAGSVAAELNHQGEVRSAVFSPDGTLVATASSDATARIWKAASGVPQGDILQHTSAVYFAAFSPDGKRIATASRDQSARVWETRSGHPVTAPLTHAAPVFSVAFSPDGMRVVTASGAAAGVWEVYHEFDNPGDLVKLLEGVGGMGSGDGAPPMPAGDAARLIADLRAGSGRQAGPTAEFISWFLAHRP